MPPDALAAAEVRPARAGIERLFEGERALRLVHAEAATPRLDHGSALALYRDRAYAEFLLRHRLVAAPAAERLERFRTGGVTPRTAFFRHPKQLRAIREVILPASDPGRIVRMASVGCSMGCEPYSLLLSLWESRDRLAIEGFDVNPELLAVARAGAYARLPLASEVISDLAELALPRPDEAYRLEGVTEEDLAAVARAAQPWATTSFAEVDLERGLQERAQLLMSPEARRRVRFSEADILQQPLPREQDVILLMNVLMHFSPAGREQILRNVAESLAPGGWLLTEEIIPPFPFADDYIAWMQDLSRFGLTPARTLSLQSDRLTEWISVKTGAGERLPLCRP